MREQNDYQDEVSEWKRGNEEWARWEAQLKAESKAHTQRLKEQNDKLLAGYQKLTDEIYETIEKLKRDQR
jgi:hypothetical protein